ncbi:MAG: reductive dehalogenase domain-containing protein [Chloroflexota bacterium]
MTLVIFLSILSLPHSVHAIILGLLGITLVVGLVLFLLPVGNPVYKNDQPRERFDERDIMFARARLVPESEEYQSYYRMRPENLDVDEELRRLPGLLSWDARYADPLLFAAPEASFFLTGLMREAVDGPVNGRRINIPPEQLSEYIKNLARYFGAADVGVADLQPYHIYSHVGRGTGEYGAPISVDHRFAIALTVEMEFEMVATAPYAPTSMETGRQYVESGRIAVQLAAVLRNLGYASRAHIDGNYRVIAPLVARDAGLGEIGRMGLLMTPALGPRVRLAVVTTDAGLVPDRRKPDLATLDFCSICLKCARCCPSKAIQDGPRVEIDGAYRWRIDSEACFRYWNIVGTDCARCMMVCPYSHPDSTLHNIVRWGITRSGMFRRAASKLDDTLYGQRPVPHPGPGWIPMKK